MEKRFNEEDGILLIRQMIDQAKGNLQRGAGKYFVLWGYVISITCLTHFSSYMIFGKDTLQWSRLIWAVPVILGILVSILLGIRDGKRKTVRTYVSTLISRVWVGFACCALLIPFLIGREYGVFIYPAISFVYAYAIFLSASAFRMKWMYISVAICVICVILYKFVPYAYYPLLMATMLISGNLIPGHVINYKAKRNV